jgi:hypothetical protein
MYSIFLQSTVQRFHLSTTPQEIMIQLNAKRFGRVFNRYFTFFKNYFIFNVAANNCFGFCKIQIQLEKSNRDTMFLIS